MLHFIIQRIIYNNFRSILLKSDICARNQIKLFSSNDKSNLNEDESKELVLSRPSKLQKGYKKKESNMKSINRKSKEIGLEADLVSAVEEVSKSVVEENNKSKVKSDLLNKLLEHSLCNSKVHVITPVSSIFTGLKLENQFLKNDKYGIERRSNDQRKLNIKSFMNNKLSNQPNYLDQSQFQKPRTFSEKYKYDKKKEYILFSDQDFGIIWELYPKKASLKDNSLIAILEDQEKEEQLQYLPKNAFEEMIKWTKERKLWNFPINNEQDMEEESKVSFHEHIFFDEHIKNFAKSGPIRHFIELVTVGLSKNPNISVEEKHAHIEWYKEYFKDKLIFVED